MRPTRLTSAEICLAPIMSTSQVSEHFKRWNYTGGILPAAFARPSWARPQSNLDFVARAAASSTRRVTRYEGVPGNHLGTKPNHGLSGEQFYGRIRRPDPKLDEGEFDGRHTRKSLSKPVDVFDERALLTKPGL